MEIIATSPSHAVIETIQAVRRWGDETAPRGAPTLEVPDFTIRILEPNQLPLQLPGRGLSRFIAAVEALQLIGQTTRPELAAAGSKGLGMFRDGGIFWGGYGQRVHGYLDEVVRVLKCDSSSRRAVLTVFDSRDIGREKLDIPCTLTIQFMLRMSKLTARVSMRSNDAWLGLPYDLFQFSSLQGAVAAALGVEQGTYTHTVGSMHLYVKDFEKSESATTYLFAKKQELWAPGAMADISARARKILDNKMGRLNTEHEVWLERAIKEGASSWNA